MRHIFVGFFCCLTSSLALAWPPYIGIEAVYKSKRTEAAYKERARAYELSQKLLGLKMDPKNDTWQIPTAEGEYAESKRFLDAIIAVCKGCTVKIIPGKFNQDNYEVHFPNKYWIVVSADPGVSELQTPELPYEQYDALEPFFEESINKPGSTVGLKPIEGEDGHLNLGALSTFETAENLAEFFLDQFNHPELAYGVLGQDMTNGPHLTSLTPKQIEQFLIVMDEAKAHKFKSIGELAKAINERVYTNSKHYQGVSVKRLESPSFPDKDMPVEIRYTAGQPTFRRTLNMFKLMIKRIEFLRRRPQFSNLQRQQFKDPRNMSYHEKLSRFYIFVVETGESFENYRHLINDREIRERGTLDNFVWRTTPWKNGPKSFETIARYIPDLETSEWVQNRFREIIVDPATPQELRGELINAFKASINRPDMLNENKRAIFEFQKSILEERDWIPEPPQPEKKNPCGQVRVSVFRRMLSIFGR